MRLTPLALAIAASLALTSCAPSPPTVSEQELVGIMATRNNLLVQEAVAYGLDADVAIPKLVRWVTLEESGEVVAECLRDFGIDATATDDGGFSYTFDADEDIATVEELHERASRAFWECHAKYSVDPRTSIPFTPAQYHTLYNYFDAELRRCLSERGFVVDPAQGEHEFVDDYARGGNPWSPYDKVFQGNLSDADWAKLQSDCPRMPPFTELYGPLLPKP